MILYRTMTPQPPEDHFQIGTFTPMRTRQGMECPGNEIYGAYTDDWYCRAPFRPGLEYQIRGKRIVITNVTAENQYGYWAWVYYYERVTK